MRIGIDCRLWNESGIGRYLRSLVREISYLDTTDDFILFGNKGVLDKEKFGKNFEIVDLNIVWYSFKEQLLLPKILSRYNLDLVHFPHFNVPIMYKGRFVVTIHDLIHQKYSMSRSTKLNPLAFRLKSFGYKKVFANALSNASKIIVPSKFVSKDIEVHYKVDTDKVRVIYEGIDEGFREMVKSVSSESAKVVLEKLGIKRDYIFYVGNAHPHKNIEGLIAGYKQIKKRFPELLLVLAGKENFFWKRVLRESGEVEGLIYLGLVSDRELACLLKKAKALVQPSFEEGFGLPLLEAFVCDCAVVSSDGGSLKEIGGKGALYFDPRNIEDMVAKIGRVLSDKNLRGELIKEGRRRVEEFSWRENAIETLEIYNRVVA